MTQIHEYDKIVWIKKIHIKIYIISQTRYDIKKIRIRYKYIKSKLTAREVNFKKVNHAEKKN